MSDLKLNVRNIETKAMFLHELQGQLSDGFWENAKPRDHWKMLCSLKPKDVIIIAPELPEGFLGLEGFDRQHYFTPRLSYNFANPELIKAVGMRMLAIARLSRTEGVASAERDAVTISTIQDRPTPGDRKGVLVNGLQADRLYELANEDTPSSAHWMDRIYAIHTLYAKMGGTNVHLKLKLKAQYIIDTLNDVDYSMTDMRNDLKVLSRTLFHRHPSN